MHILKWHLCSLSRGVIPPLPVTWQEARTFSHSTRHVHLLWARNTRSGKLSFCCCSWKFRLSDECTKLWMFSIIALQLGCIFSAISLDCCKFCFFCYFYMSSKWHLSLEFKQMTANILLYNLMEMMYSVLNTKT
jgi:hypothetical protein